MITPLLIPQLGEGLREVKLIKQFKAVGESIALDEPIYEVETAKAVVQVESPVAGRISAWKYTEGDDVAVGAEVVEIESGETVRKRIAPRARAYARSKGLSEADLARIPAAKGALQLEDIDRWFDGQKSVVQDYSDVPFSARQSDLNRRAFGDTLAPVPATVRRPIDWSCVTKVHSQFSGEHPDLLLSEFQILVFAAVQASRSNPRFRSRWLNKDHMRQYEHLDAGIAVRLPGDELATVVIRQVDTLAFPELSSAISAAMKSAVRGKEESPDERTTLMISSLIQYGIVDADPVLTPPATAVLFFGAPYSAPEGPKANLTLTFDHRVANGVGAALFLQEIDNVLKQMGHDAT